MKGMIVAPQPRATDAGAAVLAAGGNAIDAAVATAFAQGIDDPFMCGIGGMGTATVYLADGGAFSLGFYDRAGSAVSPDMYAANTRDRSHIGRAVMHNDYRSELGYTSVMVPGMVAGLHALHQRAGKLAWADVLAPAIALARSGMLVMPFVMEYWTRQLQPGLADGRTRLAATEACRRIYLRSDGSFHQVGDTIENPDLVRTLERIAAGGAEVFYRGDLAREIATDLADNGAYVRAEDLASFRTRDDAPVRGTYRGYEIVSNPPPGGGMTVVQILNILENFDIGAMDPTGADYIDLLARAMQAAHADRFRYLADPEFVDVPLDRLLSKEHAAALAKDVKAGTGAMPPREAPPSCTTHLSAVDAAGNAVAITHTLGTASGAITPGLGFVYNNSMKLFDPDPASPNAPAPGKSRAAAMSPTIVLKDGEPYLVVGSPAGTAIISAVVQAIINVLDFDMRVVEAVTAPRIHCESAALRLEARFQQTVCDDLAARGHDVIRRPMSFDALMGRAHAILRRDGTLTGGNDPRGGGGGIAKA